MKASKSHRIGLSVASHSVPSTTSYPGKGSEEVGRELITGDGEQCSPIHACAWHALAIGHCDRRIAVADHGETAAASHFLGDEVVRRARVDERVDGDIAEPEAHLHGLGVDAGDCMQQYE